MRQLIFILLAIIGVSQAQTIQYIGAPTTTVISRGNFRSDSLFYLPKRLKAPTDTAALRYQISDSSVYVWTGSAWRKAGGIDTTSLSNRINLKLNISDTASMLSPYYRSATATAALATKLNISDTSTMLTPYLRKADTTAMLSPYYRSATASAALALKVNISDTSTMLGNYVRHAGFGLTKSGQGFLVDTAAMATRARVQKAVDSLQGNINAKGSGTVTSVATGYGLSGGTITTTGTLLVDTLNISTRAWRQKGIDSIISIIPANQISGSGTSNRILKYTGATTVGNSQITDNGTNIGFNVSSPQSLINTPETGQIQIGTSSWPTNFVGKSNARALFGNEGLLLLWNEAPAAAGNSATIYIGSKGGGTNGSTTIAGGAISGVSESSVANTGQLRFFTNGGSGNVERLRIFGNGRVFVGSSPSDGGYQLDVNGSLRTISGANFATTSGSVGVGTTSPLQIIHAKSSAGSFLQLTRIGQGTTTSLFGGLYFGDDTTIQASQILSGADGNLVSGNLQFVTRAQAGSLIEAFRVTSSQEILVNTISDAGNYALQVSGGFYTTGVSVLSASGETFIATTGDAGDYKLQVGGNIYATGSLTSGSPSGGDFKPWKLGEAATVSPTSPNRTIRVEIDGTVYYLHAKTTND